MDTMANRLARALKARNMDAPSLIKALNASKGTVYNILDGTTKADKVRAATLIEISRILRISFIWLAYGEGDMESKGDAPPPSREVAVATSEIRPGYVRIARLAVEAAAGTGAVVDDETEVVEMLDVADWWAQQHLPRDTSQVRVITARGDSMAPDIQHGDVLFVDISKPRFEAPGLYVMNWAGRAMVKRLSPEFAARRLALLSSNPAYPPEYIDVREVDSLHIAGRVAAWWTLRKF